MKATFIQCDNLPNYGKLPFLYKGWHEKNKDIFYVMIGPKVGLKKYLESSQTSSNFTLQQCIVKNHRHYTCNH